MILLTLDELIVIANRVIAGVAYRDIGLLHAAAARPAATFDGKELYPELCDKAAALVHSVVRSHALVDGNKRLGLAALLVTLRVNGRRLTLTNDQAYDLIVAIADGTLDEVDEIAAAVCTGSESIQDVL